MPSILKSLLSAFSGGPFYVRISRDRLKVRDASGSGYFDDEPLVGLSEDPPIITAIGGMARTTSARWINPFAHPRVLLDDFLIAEKLLMHAFRVVSGKTLVRASPIAVVHVTDKLDGGLSQIERRALQELMLSAGARESHIWEGRELTDGELRSGVYKSAP